MAEAPKVPETHAERVDAAVLLVVRGASVDAVRSQLLEWAGAHDAAELALAEATERLRKAGETTLDVERGKAVRRLEDLFGRCLRNADYGRCLAIQKELHAVTGLTGTVRAPKLAADTSELDAEISRLESALGVR